MSGWLSGLKLIEKFCVSWNLSKLNWEMKARGKWMVCCSSTWYCNEKKSLTLTRNYERIHFVMINWFQDLALFLKSLIQSKLLIDSYNCITLRWTKTQIINQKLPLSLFRDLNNLFLIFFKKVIKFTIQFLIQIKIN